MAHPERNLIYYLRGIKMGGTGLYGRFRGKEGLGVKIFSYISMNFLFGLTLKIWLKIGLKVGLGEWGGGGKKFFQHPNELFIWAYP